MPQYLTTQEVAALLRRSATTIWRLTRRSADPLPGRRLGGTLLFDRDEIDAWVQRQPRLQELTPQPTATILPFVQRVGAVSLPKEQQS